LKVFPPVVNDVVDDDDDAVGEEIVVDVNFSSLI
jgi:hypothetical protein